MQLLIKVLVIIFIFSFWTLSSQKIDSPISKDSLPIKQKEKSSQVMTNKLKDSLLKVNLNKKIIENGGAIGFFFYSLSSKLDSLLNVRDSLSLVQKRLRIIAPKPVKKIEDVTIQDYRIFYFDGSQEFVDTTLNIKKEYSFNYLRKDYFELLPLHNTAQGFNKLGYDFNNEKLKPQMGARAKHFGYMEKEDFPYFEVPTALTELFFKTTLEQGQLLDALITVNTSPRFNFSIAHKGLRSLGNYVSSMTNGTHFRMGTMYTSRDYRYNQRIHFVAQRLDNQINGGLDSLNVYFYEKAIEDFDYDGFLDRSRLFTNEEADNRLKGKRYFIDHNYAVIMEKSDTLKNYERKKILTIGHTLNHETKEFAYIDTSPKRFFGDYLWPFIDDRSKFRVVENDLCALFRDEKIGLVKFGFSHTLWDYVLKTKLYDLQKDNEEIDDPIENKTLKKNQLAIFLNWQKILKGYEISASSYNSIKKDFATQKFDININKTWNQKWFVKARINFHSVAPNFNFQIHMSDFINHNWDNLELENQVYKTFGLNFGNLSWFNLDFNFQRLNNYSYFKVSPLEDGQNILEESNISDQLQIYPFQFEGEIDYLKIRLFQQLSIGKFSLYNTIQYQKVKQINDQEDSFNVLNVPEFITRNTIVFSTEMFKKALYLQTGLNFQFFSKYYADRYSGLIGEFASQNDRKIGEYPRLDFFINAKVQQTRIYFKFEHFNSPETGYNYYSAPFNPYKDSVIRFGLVWNFFQ
ncbi:MAG: hypothetical protein CMC57_04580 [Flavobacteriaceae bacterium]|nr:hypothetical protein [Flavobacteriaceae bacterium]